MTEAASTLTVVAVAIAKDSSLASSIADAAVLGWPPPVSPPISTRPPPASPEASMVAPASTMFSPVTTTVPPVVPLSLPAAEIWPASLTVWVGAPAPLLAPVAALSTILPLRVPIEFASITPLLLMTESTTARAAAAVSSTRPPLALSLPVLRTSDLRVLPVWTSLTAEAI